MRFKHSGRFYLAAIVWTTPVFKNKSIIRVRHAHHALFFNRSSHHNHCNPL